MAAICAFLPSVLFGTWDSKAFPETLMVTPQEDSVKLDSEATGIPGPASIIPASSLLIGDDLGSKAVGPFLYLSGVHRSKLVFQSWVLNIPVLIS